VSTSSTKAANALLTKYSFDPYPTMLFPKINKN